MLDPLIPVRRLSALQKQILTVLAALDERRPGPVATRDIELQETTTNLDEQ